jgi:hypothetical protein
MTNMFKFEADNDPKEYNQETKVMLNNLLEMSNVT